MNSDSRPSHSPESDTPQAVFLGTGTSTGVPLIGCNCPVCTSTDPRDHRLRSGLHVSYRGFHLQIDTPPDFRQQALRGAFDRVDAVLITHSHVDHIFGLDDLRRFNTIQKSRIPVHASRPTLEILDRIFDYFQHPAVPGGYLPQLDFVPHDGPFTVGPFAVTPIKVIHGAADMWGYRLDVEGGHSLAYVSDCFEFPLESRNMVRGVGVLVLDALRDRPHGSHMTIDESIRTIQDIAPRRGFLTHIGHDVSHADLLKRVPNGIQPAYDGLSITW